MTYTVIYDTEQKLFDAVVEEARKDMRRCANSRIGCSYRSKSTDLPKACLIGRLIPDEKYSEKLEGKFANSCYVMDAAGIDWPLGDFARSLQSIHDERDPLDWESAFLNLARSRALVYNPPAN